MAAGSADVRGAESARPGNTEVKTRYTDQVALMLQKRKDGWQPLHPQKKKHQPHRRSAFTWTRRGGGGENYSPERDKEEEATFRTRLSTFETFPCSSSPSGGLEETQSGRPHNLTRQNPETTQGDHREPPTVEALMTADRL